MEDGHKLQACATEKIGQRGIIALLSLYIGGHLNAENRWIMMGGSI